MKIEANTPDEYIAQLPEDRQKAVSTLRELLQNNLPEGFEERMSYGMIGYIVPHSVYPAGYHCDPKLPLPFINIASQKNFIALYHMGIYANKNLLDWFIAEYPKHCTTKLDMGKSCIRFKKIDKIPFGLITELAKKMSCSEWIDLYEQQIKR
ncbi:DUF1801 domain-containing protein [Draconibacterium sp. IB214405]|uniref:DUF1801 domain-containing protein n=1 Tax=Draconibacterium sp. IB214405 TaxID=3097352 RepID=UPI002A13B178|nr:DUF1801 domain-containing protein [Draconibacterium sp. IB214405]MDX8341736.1 DUF1801 domain-containing protein [Draconibacterium sp. IB214405]